MHASEPARRRVSVDLSDDLLDWLDSLKPEFGLRSRGAILERLLGELRDQGNDDDEDEASVFSEETTSHTDHAGTPSGLSAGSIDESTAIVLIRSEYDTQGDQAEVPDETAELGGALTPWPRATRRPAASPAGDSGRGIQLPGFVRQQARELRRSLHADTHVASERGLALITPAQLSEALDRVELHWSEVYGQPATEPVLEAAMVWLARDVWPQSDHSDGRPFTWSLTQQVVSSFAPSWSDDPPSLSRVMTAAGVLEDPFSGSTLPIRIPTLITRFVQRHRSRQKRTMSFEAIDQSMTVHAALRLLLLPTIADRPYTLQEIREAYREQAQSNHPDAGGSADAMRRLNEAYQFLKERYRRSA